MKIRYLILLALLAYGAGLVVAMPAKIALAWAPPLPLSGVDGRVLDGRAEAFAVTPEHVIRDLRWRFTPGQLVQGHLAAALDFSYLDGRGSALVGVDWQRRLVLGDGRFRLSAERLVNALALPLVEFDGEILAEVDSAVWQDRTLADLRGRIRWRQAALRQPLALPLGEVEAVLSQADGQVLSARISNSGGVVSIEGDIRLDGQRLQTDLRLRPLAGAPADLAQLLGNIARRQSDGSYRVQRVAELNNLL